MSITSWKSSSEITGGRRPDMRESRVCWVAYLGAADNVSRLLPSLLSDIPQPVIRSRNLFSRLHPVRLVYL
jgi:hypothetical protein